MDGVALGLGSLALYLLLGQRAIWGQDAYYLVSFQAQGIDHPVHVLYLRLVGLLTPALEGLGLTLFQAMRACSALGAALAAVLWWRAARVLGLPRAPAALVAVLCAVAPAVVFFATVVEIHGVFAAFAALSAAAFARSALRPTWGAGLALGAATALATLVHASGHLLLWLWGCGLAARALRREQTWAGASRAFAAAAVAHAALVAAGSAWLQPPGLERPLAGQVGFLSTWLRPDLTLAWLPHTLLAEWLWPFLPMSVLAWLVLRRRGGGSRALALAAALAAYLVASCAILQDTTERGAYLLPLAWPAAMLVARALPRRMVVLAAATALLAAVVGVRTHDAGPIDDAFGAGTAALAAERPVFVLCADTGEVDSILRGASRVPCVSLERLLLHLEALDIDYDGLCAAFDPWVAAQSGGRAIYLSARGLEWMRAAAPSAALRRFAREHLPAHYHLEPIQRVGFRGYRMVGK